MTLPVLLAQTTQTATNPAPIELPASLSWLEFLTKTFFLHNSLLQWTGLFGVLLVSFVAGKLVSMLLERHGKKVQEGQRLYVLALLFTSMSGPVKMIALAGGLYVAGQFMHLTYKDGNIDLQSLWDQCATTIAVLATAWYIFRLVDVIEFYLRRWTSRTETTLDDQLVPLLRKTLRVFVVIIAALFIAQNVFRWDIGALIAGLGVGGLAFALAAKDMLSNLFGSMTIFMDRPFTMGHFVRIQGHLGVIEEVGFRSTRVRTLDGHLVTIPNSVVANEPIENITRRPSIRRLLNVTVTYDTPPEKVQRGVDIIHEMLEARKDKLAVENPYRVYFSDFNAASLNIVVYYWFSVNDWWAFQEFNHEFNMELLRRYNEEGIEFAFPTQTLYVKQDSPFEASVRMGARDPSPGSEG